MKHIGNFIAVKKRLDMVAKLHGIERLTSTTPQKGFIYHKKKKKYFEKDTPFRKRLIKLIQQNNQGT